MTSLIDIQNQIGKLQRQAEDIKRKDLDKTIKEIQAKISAFGITQRDLFPAKGKRGKTKVALPPAKRSGTAGKKVEPKYRGPQGETWSGRGLAPKWLVALESEGKLREEFAIRP